METEEALGLSPIGRSMGEGAGRRSSSLIDQADVLDHLCERLELAVGGLVARLEPVISQREAAPGPTGGAGLAKPATIKVGSAPVSNRLASVAARLERTTIAIITVQERIEV